jgi:hypothetical protein
MIKRIGLGLLTTALISAAFGLVPDFLPETWAGERVAGYFYVWAAVPGACVAFLAALGGAYVARAPFVVPAVVFAIGTWAVLIYVLNSIAVQAGQGDILAIAGSNAPGLLLGIVGAATGAYVGERLSRRSQGGIASSA